MRKRGARGGARGSKSSAKKEAARGLSAYELDTVADGELARVLLARMVLEELWDLKKGKEVTLPVP